MMRTLLPIIAVSAILIGCQQETAAGRGDARTAPMNDPQITVLSADLRPWLVFQPAVIVREAPRPMQVEIPVRNTAGNSYLIDYRIIFYDEFGRELEPVMSWRPESIDPQQVLRLKGKALDGRAVNYKIEIRWAR